jgi:Arm DNA-binding domain
MIASGLSAQFVRTAKPGRYCDGDGLYLLVKKSGARFWVFRYKVNGSKLREAGLGRAGEGRNSVRLAEAREKASVLFRRSKMALTRCWLETLWRRRRRLRHKMRPSNG